MKLLCDHMLGSLARWLRFMGYDTAYPDPAAPDRVLIDRARSEDRIVLTRDKELARRIPGAIQIRSDDMEEQIREVARVLPLRLIDPLSRCSLCNDLLVPASPGEVKGLVPEGVQRRHASFWRCPGCRRVYWQGSHWDKMVARLNDFDLPRST
jgi:uncharacterized protein with PIN domain